MVHQKSVEKTPGHHRDQGMFEDPEVPGAIFENLYNISAVGLGGFGTWRPVTPPCRLRKTCILQQNCSKTCILAS